MREYRTSRVRAQVYLEIMFITIRILWERYVRIFWIVTSQTLENFF
uniref:Uncharacterized protein n=1 Tax=Anguilla anguilla TaxID=7936 RepID=A0A0E9VNL3_ANGAN